MSDQSAPEESDGTILDPTPKGNEPARRRERDSISRTSVRRSLLKHLSKAACAENFNIDDDYWSFHGSESEYSSLSGSPQCHRFELHDESESECSGRQSVGLESMFAFSNMSTLLDAEEEEEDELEGMYNFDEEKIAAILQQALAGSKLNQEELEDLIAQSMQETFLARHQAFSPRIDDSENPELMPGTLSARMTPGRGTPETGSPKVTPNVSPKSSPRHAEGQLNITGSIKRVVPGGTISPMMTPRDPQRQLKLAGSPTAFGTPARSARRSSMILSNKRLSLALDSALASHRQELAAAGSSLTKHLTKAQSNCCDESASSEVAEAVELETSRMYQQHRSSLLQAAEVVGIAASRGDDSVVVNLEEQLNMVQRAVQGARRKHRQSIAQVVAAQGQEEVRDPNAEQKTCSPPNGSLRERLDKLAAAWVQQEEARRRQAVEMPKKKQVAGAKHRHQGYLALLKTRTSLLGCRPNRCTNRGNNRRGGKRR